MIPTEKIAARLAELQAEFSARVDVYDMPIGSMTPRQVDEYVTRGRVIEGLMREIHRASSDPAPTVIP